MSDPLIGKTLGQFEILEAIGQGGMAMVYKARQPAMNRSVALKVLSTPMAANPTFLARFREEAQTIASLEHAHILPVYDMGEQDGWVFIAMRYMSHGALSSRIAQGPIPLKDIGQWIEQIGSALNYAHQRGASRDLQISNHRFANGGGEFGLVENINTSDYGAVPGKGDQPATITFDVKDHLGSGIFKRNDSVGVGIHRYLNRFGQGGVKGRIGAVLPNEVRVEHSIDIAGVLKLIQVGRNDVVIALDDQILIAIRASRAGNTVMQGPGKADRVRQTHLLQQEGQRD